MTLIFFDIETAPDIERAAGRFDPAKVKVGNLKDPEKIRAKIDEAREAALEKAALSPATGTIVAIGYGRRDIKPGGLGEMIFRTSFEGRLTSERFLIEQFWERYTMENATMVNWAGCQRSNFDRKWLIRRSWALGVPVPESAYDNSRWINLTTRFLIGEEFTERCSLENAARELGLSVESTDPVCGANFHEFWSSKDPEKVAAAEKYLAQDVTLLEGMHSAIYTS